MNKLEKIRNVFNRVGEIAKTTDFISAGLTNYDVAHFCNLGEIERIRNGFYQLKNKDIKEEQAISRIMPDAVVCVESALFHYGYNDFTPRKWTIAVPRSFFRKIKQMQEFPIKAYYIQDEYLNLGLTTDDFSGVTMSVYDRERTICDCFKYRTKLDSELFNKAINAYVNDNKKNLRNLSKYAREMGIYNKVMNVMGVILNG